MTLRPARGDDVPRIARLHREVRETYLSYLPVLHSPQDDLRYFARLIPDQCDATVAIENGELIGFVCARPGWIDHLYVKGSSHGHGVGTSLLNLSVADGTPRSLWTFQRNALANYFYLSRGWAAVEHTVGDRNEESEPDTRYVWPGPPPRPLELVTPSPEYLVGFVAALDAGWSPSSERDTRAATLADVHTDPSRFLRGLVHGASADVLADGTRVDGISRRVFWLWDGAFCGSINLRHVPGTETLPAHVSGHVGYAVVPWKRRRGYATQALAAILAYAREVGLLRVLLTCNEDNFVSRRVIEANGGVYAGPAPPQKRAYWIDTRVAAVE